MRQLILDESERRAIDRILEEAIANSDSIESPEALARASVLAHELPRRIREALVRFRLDEPPSGVLLISGFSVDNVRIGPTPSGLEPRGHPSLAAREEAYLVLIASLLGDPIAWLTQQSGRVIHEVCPLKEHEHMQLGTGCQQLLWWHTEDAFHPLRGDYLAMLCLRNTDRIGTMIGSIGEIELDDDLKSLLFEPLYAIQPDESHRGHTDSLRITEVIREQGGHDRRVAAVEQVPVLFGLESDPYLRIDPYFMEPPEEPEARRALEALIKRLEASLMDLVLQPGDVCLIDNYRVVHGRRPFQARFDGTDRWLKRVNVARDLRKSLVARGDPHSRIIQH